MKVKERYSIVEFRNPGGSIAYRVTGRSITGERIRRNFNTLEIAIGEKSRLEVEAANQYLAQVPRLTTLSEKQLRDAELAIRLLGGKNILAAAKYYDANYREPVQQVKLCEASKQFLADKKASNCRPLTIQNLRIRVNLLAKEHGNKPVSQISPDLIRGVINRPGLKPSTRDNIRRALSSFFSWAERMGYCKPSPMKSISAIRVDRDEPKILTRIQISDLLCEAKQYKDGVMLPYIALALFAAVRPNELSQLTWDDIDIDEGLITIGSRIAKMRQRRLVEISDNLVSILAPFVLSGAPITPKNFRRDFDTVKALAGFAFMKHRVNFDEVAKRFPEYAEEGASLPTDPAWTPDVLRHTAISYHLAKYSHEGKTASWAGNSPDIIQKHYKGLVKPKDVIWFWNLNHKNLDDLSNAA